MKALVLSGGGSRGAYQAGCWRALHETGWRPDYIVGTSVGAVNGLMIVMDDVDQMQAWWENLQQRNVLRVRGNILAIAKWRSFMHAEPLRAAFDEHADFDAVRRDGRLHVTTTDIEQGTERLWRPDEIDIEVMMATTALLPGLAPVEIDGDHHADGGHWTALPLRHALEAGATDVQVLLHDPIEPHAMAPPKHLRQVLRRQSDILWHGRQFAEWKWLQARMRLPKRDPERLQKANVTFHAPDPPLETEILRFRRHEAKDLYARGYAATKANLAANPITAT